MLRSFGFAVLLCGLAGEVRRVEADSWPQFRGPNATGCADSDHKLPTEIGPTQNVLWKTPLPTGISCPVVHGDRVYVTAEREKRLLTLGIDRTAGRVLWEAEAPYHVLEQINQIGSYAQPTPATDGQRVVVLFGSCGLFCYDRDGKQLWHRPLGPFKNDFGAGASPILVGDRVILSQDHDTASFVMALDKRTGKTIWKTDRSEFPRSYATPVIWDVEGKKQIVVAGTLRVVGYEFETGKELWTVRGLARIVNMTPQVGPDGILYLAAWSPGGDAGDRIEVATFDEMLRQHDKNKNGTLENDEAPDGPVKQRFTQIDLDKDGHITRAEYEIMKRVFTEARNVVVAVRPGGQGDITESHVLWVQNKMLPYVPSPLYYNGFLFMVKDGGLVNCLNAKTGKPAKQGRVQSGGYFSSPVAGDGKIYLVSHHGEVTVISGQPEWEILSRSRLGKDEEVIATPAIAGGRIYLRTTKHLYCFGLTETR